MVEVKDATIGFTYLLRTCPWKEMENEVGGNLLNISASTRLIFYATDDFSTQQILSCIMRLTLVPN